MQAEREKCYKYSNQILTWAGKSCATSQRNDSIWALTLSSPWALQSLGGLSGMFAESCHWGQTKAMLSPAPLERQVWAPVRAGELQNSEQLLFFLGAFSLPFPDGAALKMNIRFPSVNQKLILLSLCCYVYSLRTFSNLIRIDFFFSMILHQICLLFAGLRRDGNKLLIEMQVNPYFTEKMCCLHKKYNKWSQTKIHRCCNKISKFVYHWTSLKLL